MGNYVFKPAIRASARPLKNYNVEYRAMKLMEKDKPTPAPPHPVMEKIMDEIRNDPSLEERTKVDPILADKLQHVYLRSRGTNTEIIRKTSNLPKADQEPASPEYGFTEPAVIPPGKASFRQILDFMKLHQENPEEYPAYKIAEMYNLDVNDVSNVLKNFKPFVIYYPDTGYPEIPKLKNIQSNVKSIKPN